MGTSLNWSQKSWKWLLDPALYKHKDKAGQRRIMPSLWRYVEDFEWWNKKCKVLKGPNEPGSSLYYTNEANVTTQLVLWSW